MCILHLTKMHSLIEGKNMVKVKGSSGFVLSSCFVFSSLLCLTSNAPRQSLYVRLGDTKLWFDKLVLDSSHLICDPRIPGKSSQPLDSMGII